MRRIIALLLLLALCISCAGAESHNWYEVFVRSYQDSDGDGLGDLKGLTGRLPYLRDMGWDGLWLMPVMPSPSYHKYDVTDYLGIDPEYGTLADFDALVAAAHAEGFRIIIDLPVNHTSTAHPWFAAAAEALRKGEDSPYLDYYHFNRTGGSGYVRLDGTDWFYEEQFAGGGMPDLNLDSEAVREEIRAILDCWLNGHGVDGFRLDAVTSFWTGDPEKNIAFLGWLKETCEALKPGSYLVGECWAGLSVIADYYRSGVDSFFLFPASQAEGFLVGSLRGRSGRAEKFAKQYGNVLEAIPEGTLAPFLCNHDTGRTIGSVQGRSNLPAAKFVEGLLNMLGGNVFTYYGEEIGMVGSGADPNKRLAMYWSDGNMTQQPPGVTNIEYAYPSVEAQMADPASLLNYMRQVNRARQALPVIAEGENTFLIAEGDVCLMRREKDGESCLIALNFNAKAAESCEVPDGAAILHDLETGGETAVLDGTALTMPPYAIVILSE